jgi:hypothetical protein
LDSRVPFHSAGDTSTTTVDSGKDATLDAAPDATLFDAGSDTKAADSAQPTDGAPGGDAAEASSDAGSDAGSDATLDALLDAPADVVVDTGPLADVETIFTTIEPYSLAVDPSYLYVGVRDQGVYRVEKDGSSSAHLTATESVWRVDVSGNNVYFATNAGEVKVVPNTSDAGSAEATLASGQFGVLSVRVLGSTVYFGIYAGGSGVDVRAFDLADGGLEAGAVRPVTSQLHPYDFVVDDAWVYGGSTLGSPQSFLQVPHDGGAGAVRAASQYVISNLGLREGYVYWSTRGNGGASGTVMRAAVDGGAVQPVVTGEGPVAGIAVDDTNVYWVTYEANGVVRKAALAGGPPVTLAVGQTNAFSIAVDDAYVYWATYVTNGAVMRVPK